MRYEHRILIGVTGAIGKMGPQSQLITNKVATLIGQEIGAELLSSGKINDKMPYEEIWKVINEEINIDNGATVEKEAIENKAVITVTIRKCNVCPKKIGKYPLPATACPIGGIFKGVCESINKEFEAASLDLIPGDTCKVVIRE